VPPAFTVACWNVAWKRPASVSGRRMAERMLEHAPEVACIAEGFDDSLGDGWFGIASAADSGYPVVAGRRKVALWSRRPWREVDRTGAPALPEGRFVSGVTDTPIGPVRIIGVCVPWSHAHVTHGRKDRSPWEDHNAYLDGLAAILAGCDPALPAILIGDLNQRIPRSRAPLASYDRLMAALGSRFAVWTGGPVPDLDDRPVCHIAGTVPLAARRVIGLSRRDGNRAHSDHDGLVAEIG
jgi:endonuclease/exonuclease/phosphatase family metal-dependent hydrolase